MYHVGSFLWLRDSTVVLHGLWSTGVSVIEAHRINCLVACGILVPRPGIEPASPALQGRFLITGPPRKSLLSFIIPSSQLLTIAFDHLPTDTCPTLAAHPFLPVVPWVWASLAPGLYQRGPGFGTLTYTCSE